MREEMQDRYGEYVPSFLLTPAPLMIFLRSSAQKILEARAFRPDAPMLLSHSQEVAFTVAALAAAGVHGRYDGCQQVGQPRDEIGSVHDDQGGGEGAAGMLSGGEAAGHGVEILETQFVAIVGADGRLHPGREALEHTKQSGEQFFRLVVAAREQQDGGTWAEDHPPQRGTQGLQLTLSSYRGRIV
jgi:hypothetical protein